MVKLDSSMVKLGSWYRYRGYYGNISDAYIPFDRSEMVKHFSVGVRAGSY